MNHKRLSGQHRSPCGCLGMTTSEVPDDKGQQQTCHCCRGLMWTPLTEKSKSMHMDARQWAELQHLVSGGCTAFGASTPLQAPEAATLQLFRTLDSLLQPGHPLLEYVDGLPCRDNSFKDAQQSHFIAAIISPNASIACHPKRRKSQQ